MALLPAVRAAVLVVGEYLMVVYVETCQQGGPGGAAHGSAHIAVAVGGALSGQMVVKSRHELQRAEFNILVISQDEDDVRPRVPRVDLAGTEEGDQQHQEKFRSHLVA